MAGALAVGSFRPLVSNLKINQAAAGGKAAQDFNFSGHSKAKAGTNPEIAFFRSDTAMAAAAGAANPKLEAAVAEAKKLAGEGVVGAVIKTPDEQYFVAQMTDAKAVEALKEGAEVQAVG